MPSSVATLRTPRRSDEPASSRCRRKFLRYFPAGFRDPDYLAWERDYKAEAHGRWREQLGPDTFRELLEAGEHAEIARRALQVEGRTNLLFSFEKMALRDAVRTPAGARSFARGLYAWLEDDAPLRERFEAWCHTFEQLPRKQTRVFTWPALTVFGFLAQPKTHLFLKPNVTRRAAEAYGYTFEYRSRPNWATYASALAFATRVKRDVSDLRPRDMIDLQSFIWVQGSDEYPSRRGE
ncbi:MAG TPA: hypothetical protein VJR89_07185 [Polyangiales bacterium]|nr:hypothetical protein [Polyangiales bacterium]